MTEDAPLIVPPEEEPEPEGGLEIDGETLEEPTVPLAGEFEVTEVTRLPEDMSEREKIRKEYDGPSASIPLSDARIGLPAVNAGRKGRGKGGDGKNKE